MREILFRAKGNEKYNSGEWYFGGGIGNCAGDYFIQSDSFRWTIIPDTVCQYTGLTDKNGTKIFENDIVKYGDTLHKVVFYNGFGNAYFGIVMGNRNEVWNFSPLVPADKMFVVGNIFDSPELIGGVEE